MEIFAFIGVVIVVVGGLGLAIAASALLQGWVLTYLWVWFMVPLFDVEPLALAPAIGLGLIASYLTHQVDGATEKAKGTADVIGRTIGQVVGRPLLVLLFGWIVHLWM